MLRKLVVASGLLLLCFVVVACHHGKYSESDTHAGHGYVDMGLSVKWATCNIGADSPSDYGDYYAWGETETKQSYDADNCETRKMEIGDIGGTSRDVAHVKWGGSWRMPTKAEFEELLNEDNCTWEWTTLNGHRGYKVKSKKTGNSIFLPAAGYRSGASLRYTDQSGLYWSSSPDESDSQGAYGLGLLGDLRHAGWLTRSIGRSVRPVAATTSNTSPAEDMGSSSRESTSVVQSSTSSTSSSSSSSSIGSGTHVGHGYVDMGLSVKWATMNIGASSPGDYGNYFAWGETEVKSRFTEDNCQTWEMEIGDIGGTNRDVARVKWGGSWRIPTETEFEELFDEANCTWEWTTLNGHNGYKVKSKKTGNWIFLPAAGYRCDASLSSAGEWGSYWSSSPGESLSEAAVNLGFGSGDRDVHWCYRFNGLTVRPVATITSTTSSAEDTGSSSSSTGSGTRAGHGYVDMGLSVKWATMNIGASSPGDYGNYFAWGETETKQSYDADNCETRKMEIGDIGGTSRDVAHVKWGGSWRIPTETEFEELFDEANCTWEWTTLNGHNGYKVKSKKTGNWIFLPAAGYRSGTSLYNAGENGFYWSSTPYESNSQYAVSPFFYSGNRYVDWGDRFFGMTVRPVGEF